MSGILTGVGLGLIAVVVLVWLGLRLSMAAPMTFVDRQFRLFESWSLTRGSAWRLLGVAVLSLLMVFVLELVVAGVVLGAMFAAAGQSPRTRIEMALRASERFTAGVRRPFTILRLPAPKRGNHA